MANRKKLSEIRARVREMERQIAISGIQPVTLKARLELAASAPLRGGQEAAGGMFDLEARKQKELF